jgi:hypothetical protein
LTVVLASGVRGSYRAAGLTADTLRLLTESGQPESLRKSDVRRVERRGVNDSVSDGIAIGALAGAGTCAGLVAAAYAACNDNCDAPARGPTFLGAMSLGAGVGALTGWIAGNKSRSSGELRSTRAEEVAYRFASVHPAQCSRDECRATPAHAIAATQEGRERREDEDVAGTVRQEVPRAQEREHPACQRAGRHDGEALAGKLPDDTRARGERDPDADLVVRSDIA